MVRMADGSAGDADYGVIARTYTDFRRPEPRIAELVHAALGQARTVLNVGAGAGSYEPSDREVTAVEPSASVRAKRPAHLPSAVDATAESLPLPDGSSDAAMTTFSVHQWSDPAKGLAEGPGGNTAVTRVPIPLDCSDGFNEDCYGRPETLLDPGARQACSARSFVDEKAHARFHEHLSRDLADGTWDSRHGRLREPPRLEGSLVLLVSTPPREASATGPTTHCRVTSRLVTAVS